MFIAILSIIAVMVGIAGLLAKGRLASGRFGALSHGVSIVLIGIGLLGVLSRSFVIIGADSIGTLNRIYMGDNMVSGQVIALEGQKGPQARVLPPGFHFIPFVTILYKVSESPVVHIPQGHYGLLTARDGRPLREGQFIADRWPEQQFRQMLDGSFFLSEGKGQKGPQLTVLKPGDYRLNPFLFQVDRRPALDVPTGHVAVIRSNVVTVEGCPDPAALMRSTAGSSGAALSAPLVPKGCVGVWQEPKPPGRYYLNDKAFVSTIVPTRVQTWTYKGGYLGRKIDLIVGDDGKITQREQRFDIPVPKNAADHAINVRIQGWTIPVDLRVTVQVHPEDAPLVVASVGDLARVEDNIVTPAIRDILRSIAGEPGRKVLDLVEKRQQMVGQIEKVIAPEGAKAGVTIQEVRMGEPAIPPELMVATLREQLANQLKKTYIEEQAAQKERIKVERERATADQQPVLVKAEIEKKAASFRKDRLQLEGEGAKLKLIEIAAGQQAQVAVLGEDRVLQLQMLKETLAAATDRPDIVKVPQVYVSGEGNSLAGAAAILGASNLVRTLTAPAPASAAAPAR